MKLFGQKPMTLISLVILVLTLAAAPAIYSQDQQKETVQSAPVPGNPSGMMMHRGMMQGQGMMHGMPGPGMMQGMPGPGMDPGRMPQMHRRMMRGRDAGLSGMMEPGRNISPQTRLLLQLRRPEIQKEIGLTADQIKKLEDIAFGAARASIQGRANLQIQRLELGRMMRQDNPDRAAVDKKIDEIEQAESALRKSMIHGTLDAQSVLTKEERQKLTDLSQRKPLATGAGGAAVAPRKTMREKPASPPAAKPPANM